MADLEIATRARREAGVAKKRAILLSSHGHQITPQAISQWKKIPAERAHLISELTGVPLHDPRSDLWPRGGAAWPGFVYTIESAAMWGRK